jgi:hypothetical protein
LTALTTTVGAAVFASNGHIGTPAAFVAGFQPALIAVASLSLLGVLTAVGVQSRAPATQLQPAVEVSNAA